MGLVGWGNGVGGVGSEFHIVSEIGTAKIHDRMKFRDNSTHQISSLHNSVPL